MQGKILAISNRKGGTGKTSVAVNLAAELAARGYRVLVGDLDPQGHAGLGLGVATVDSARTIHVALREARVDLAKMICTTAVPGVDLLAADRNFDGQIRLSDPRCLARALERIRPLYDVVLLDSPPISADLIVYALLAADGVLVPTTLDYLSLDGVRQFVRAYHHVMLKLRATLLGFVVTPMQVDLRTNMQKLVLTELLQGFGRDQVIDGIRTDVGVAEAFSTRRPLRQYRMASRAIDDFRVMADDVARRFYLPCEAESGPGAHAAFSSAR